MLQIKFQKPFPQYPQFLYIFVFITIYIPIYFLVYARGKFYLTNYFFEEYYFLIFDIFTFIICFISCGNYFLKHKTEFGPVVLFPFLYAILLLFTNNCVQGMRLSVCIYGITDLQFLESTFNFIKLALATWILGHIFFITFILNNKKI